MQNDIYGGVCQVFAWGQLFYVSALHAHREILYLELLELYQTLLNVLGWISYATIDSG